MATDDDFGSAPTAFSQAGAFTPVAASAPPSVLADRYEILGLVGAGGMGRVYRAHDRTLDEIVALKMLRSELLDTPGVLERFRQEVKLARRVTNAHVVRTFDLGQHGADHFLTMEYIDGRSLAQLLEDGAPAIDEVIRIARAAAAGIAAAHANGVLHRDLKPDNILVTKAGRIVITDFGIATAVASPVATVDRSAGTPAYMAPEQVESGAITAATDIYAFGTILYEMLTGRRAFPGTDIVQVALARVQQEPPDPRAVRAVPDELAELVLRCMARKASDRFSDGAALVAALDQPQSVVATASKPLRDPGTTPERTSRSVAILPLRAPDELADISAGITEEIVDALTITRALRVRPLASVRRDSTAHADPREIGHTLGVDVVVDGSVRRRGEQVRLTARVIGVADGFQLWASHFDTTPDALLAASDQLVRAVAQALTVELDVPARAPIDLRASELYLSAKARLRATWLSGDFTAVIADLEHAHSLAPNDPAILATLSIALARSSFYGAGDAALARARDLAARATLAAPNLGDAWFARGVSALYSREVPEAATSLVRALGRSPGLAMAQAMLGGVLLEVGVLQGAIRHLEASESLDPFGLAHIDLPRAYVYAGRFDDAMQRYEQARHTISATSLTFDAIAVARFRMWRGERVPVELDEAHLPAYVREFSELSARIYETGTFDAAERERMAALVHVANPRLRASLAQFMAEFLMYCKDSETALHWIEISVDAGLHDHQWMQACPLLEPLRQLPKFRELAGRVAERANAVVAATMREVEKLR